MARICDYRNGIVVLLLSLAALPAMGQSFRVQCPTSTITHPDPADTAKNSTEPAYTGPTYTYTPTTTGTAVDYTKVTTGVVNGAIKCQQVAGGDGYASMADGTQTYMFSFGPLSVLANIANGQPGTLFPSEFNTPIGDPTALVPGYPQAVVASTSVYNGAIGQIGNNVSYTFNIYDIFEGPSVNLMSNVGVTPSTVTVVLNAAVPFKKDDQILIGQGTTGTDLNGYAGGPYTVSAVGVGLNPITVGLPGNFAFQFTLLSGTTNLPEVVASLDATASSAPSTDGQVDPRQIMEVGIMNGNIPAPLMAIDEDDEFFLTLT